jgi:hypothetical protein
MEQRADNIASHDGSFERIYTATLEKLYRANQTPAVNAGNNQTHPDLYDRILSAGIAPAYSRPAKPKRLTLAGWTCVLMFAALCLFLIVRNSS